MDILHRILCPMYIGNDWSYFWMLPELFTTIKVTCYRNLPGKKNCTFKSVTLYFSLANLQEVQALLQMFSQKKFQSVHYKLNYHMLIKNLKYVLALYFLYFCNKRWVSRNITLPHNIASVIYKIYMTKYISIIQVTSKYKAMNHLM